MAFFGVASKIGQGIARNHQLDKLIELYKEIDSNSILDHYTSEQRFICANELIDIYCSNDPKNFDRKNESLKNLYQEFKMMEGNKDLENPATKAQMYALALAIKELSFGLESDKQKIDQNLIDSRADFEQIKKDYDDQIKRLFNEIERVNYERFNEVKNEFNKYKIESNLAFNKYNMEMKNSINTIYKKIEEKDVFLQNLIEKTFKKVIIILGVSFFILLILILIF